MKPEQRRIAIAEACGWKKEYIHGNGMDCDVWVHPDGERCWPIESAPIPDYLNDLNAMHEAEIACIFGNHAKGMVYGQELFNVCKKEHAFDTGYGIQERWSFSATAAQRAEAFLRTLNLWTDTES